ncbi:MAG: lamin tail domain-containing protein [Candidatus Thermoplasmatota archaeon]|nr:lamin tail domain-containing protein [Candidatus Thermoplasmatota archaeon]
MYKKSTMKKIGSIMVVAAMVISAFTVFAVNDVAGDETTPMISINEIMYNPVSGDEWVELYNGGETAVNLTGWVLKDDADNTFGDLTNVEIPAGGYVYIQSATAILNNDEDTVYLYDDGMEEVDSAGYTNALGGDGNGMSLEYNSATDTWEESRVEDGTPGARNSVLWPDVTVVYPVGGEVIGGMVPVKWEASSPAGLDVAIAIHYKNDTAAEWTKGTEKEENDGLFIWDITGLDATEQYMVKVTATDSLGDSYYDESGLFDITGMTVTPKTIAFNETEDVEVTGTSGTVDLYKPDGTLVDSESGAPGDVIFFGVTFDDTGTWWVNDSNEGTFYILVTPIELNVSAAPEEVDFAKSGSESYVEVTGRVLNPDGTPASGATVEVWAPGVTPSGVATPIRAVTTNATGHYAFTTKVRISLYGAGMYNVTARIGDIDDANAFGFAHMAVNPIDANVTLYDMEGVSGGFATGEIVFQVLYPDGTQLLPGNDYNVSVWMGNELYAWMNTSDDTEGGNMTFMEYGKFLNITPVDIWEQGAYTLKVEVDYSGDINWEYTGEADFTIPEPDPVNVFVTPTTIDVLAPGANAQTITVEILGETRYTYGDPASLDIGVGNENVTKRIKIEGDVLYAPLRSAYNYIGEGKWEVTIFPTIGDGTIYVNVSWPGNDTVSKTITTDKGGWASVTPTSVIVDEATNISVVVKDKSGVNPIANADVTLYYETGTYGLGDMVTNGTISGDGTAGKGSQGQYEFENIVSTKANANIIVVVEFTMGGSTVYAYKAIRSEAAHDLDVTVSPEEALVGEKTTWEFNVTRDDESYGTNLQFYIMNETQLAAFHADYEDLTGMIPATLDSTGNFTYADYIDEPGVYYIYVRTPDEKHDNLNNEPSVEITRATVTVSPSLLVKNVDEDITLEFTVTWNGEAVNGTLYVYGIAETGSYEAYADGEVHITIVDGEGNLTNVTATMLTNDTNVITFEFKSAVSGSVEAEADGELEVVPPTVTVTPAKVYLFEENLITLTVKHPLTNQLIEGMQVMAMLPSGTMDLGTTDSNGKVSFGIVPMVTGYVTLLVEGDEVDQKIQIVIGLKIVCDSELEKGKEATITVTTRGGKLVQGATVKFGGETIGTTDANGEVKYKPEEKADSVEITASLTGYESATKTVTVKEGPGTPGFALLGAILGVLGALLIVRRRRR